MSWEDRDYGRSGFGRPGGDWKGIRPTLDNPMSWSVRIGRYFRVDVRVHILLVLFMAIELLRAGTTDQGAFGFYWASIWLLGLFTLVLLHEFGHVMACRMTGGEAEEILMWPLGGLAYCRPPDRWTAHLWTVIGGPLVNAVFLVAFALVLGLTQRAWIGFAIPDPFEPMAEPWWSSAPEWARIVHLVAWINLILLLFNVLLPLFPMDGARIVQALLWSKLGYVKSMRVTVRVGYFGAILLGVFALVAGERLGITTTILLFSIAFFGGFTCWTTHKQLELADEVMGFSYDEYALKLGKEVEVERQEKGPSAKALRREQKRAEQAEQEAAELDRLLQKIAKVGMDALSAREKRWLENQTKKKRQEE